MVNDIARYSIYRKSHIFGYFCKSFSFNLMFVRESREVCSCAVDMRFDQSECSTDAVQRHSVIQSEMLWHINELVIVSSSM